jgi:hypothetical protein
MNGVICHTGGVYSVIIVQLTAPAASHTLSAVGVGCIANSTFCIYKNKGHFNVPSFAEAFPMTLEIAHVSVHRHRAPSHRAPSLCFL